MHFRHALLAVSASCLYASLVPSLQADGQSNPAEYLAAMQQEMALELQQEMQRQLKASLVGMQLAVRQAMHRQLATSSLLDQELVEYRYARKAGECSPEGGIDLDAVLARLAIDTGIVVTEAQVNQYQAAPLVTASIAGGCGTFGSESTIQY